jgi:tripartite-type tricarboxylate transporter receptor subunit TctC
MTSVRKMGRRPAMAFAIMVAASAAVIPLDSVWAQTYPARPINLVVPFPPGGPTDLVARVIAQKMSEQMGQPIVVDNRPGANGNIAGAAVSRAAPDGYTVLYNTSSITLSPALYKNLGYNVKKDLAPVGLTAVVPLALVVHPSVPANTVQEFIAYAKANPDKLSYGSAGNGNVTHLVAYQFVQANGITATHIPYRGSAPANVDLAGGRIQFMTDTINSVAGFVRDNRMKLLGVTTAKRISLFPDTPTLGESGMPGFEAGAWQGMMVPSGTPADVINRLNAELNKALQSTEVKSKLALQGAEPLGSTSSQYAAYLDSELKRWGDLVKATGISLD